MGNENVARFTVDSDAESVLHHLLPLLHVIHQAFEVNVPRAHDFFDRDRLQIDRYLFPHIVRYYVKQHLRELGHDVTEDQSQSSVEMQDIAFSGLSLRYEEFNIKILKARDSQLPVAVTSLRQQFYRQRPLPYPDGFGTEALNLVLLWDLRVNYTFAGLWLVCPKDGGPSHIEVYWQLAVPDPVLSVASDAIPEQQGAEDLDELANPDTRTKAE